MTPRARWTDPETSHEAAASVRRITLTQDRILELLDDHGPMHDVELVFCFWRRHQRDAASESGIRTRRAELVIAGKVEDTGRRALLPSGRWAILWDRVNRG